MQASPQGEWGEITLFHSNYGISFAVRLVPLAVPARPGAGQLGRGARQKVRSETDEALASYSRAQRADRAADQYGDPGIQRCGSGQGRDLPPRFPERDAQALGGSYHLDAPGYYRHSGRPA